MSSEELLAQKWDKTIANFAIKTSLGAAIGVGFSFLLFKRKSWPIALATGWGAGMAYSDSTRSFNINL
ncbi:hypothetical protein BC833DRAFT_623750 [Globomyces pollinis-pini]|nr:hypothetical protein BC833DRAFT_623750 [Globomyces pollinis-pini]